MRLRTALALRRRPWLFFGVAAFVLSPRIAVRAEQGGSATTARSAGGGPSPAAGRAGGSITVNADAGPVYGDAAPPTAPAVGDDGGDSAAPPTRAESREPPVATMECAHVAAAPARARCAVEVRAAEGESIGWADAVLVTMPQFVDALRGRLGPHDATEHDATKWRWELGLVARGNGEGTVGGRVRLVVCMKGVCATRTMPFQGHIVVGE